MKYKFLFLLFVIAFFSLDGLAQCAMCKATAEQSIEQGATTAKWINGGVLYMLVVPYIAFYIMYKKWRKSYNAETKT
jgi:hypothetical protein